MDHVRIDNIDISPTNSPADVVRPLSEALETTEMALNYIKLLHGGDFGYAYHRHHNQEEVFYIQTGPATFKMETREIAVDAGEIIGFSPGELQLGTN